MMNRIIPYLLLCLIGCSGDPNSQKVIKDTSTINIPKADNKIAIVAKKDSTIPERIDPTLLPDEYDYKGRFYEGWQWYDRNGKNVLLLSVSEKGEELEEIGEKANTIELFAWQYVLRSLTAKPELLWELYDLEKECIFDITAEYILSADLTDLNNDGIKESFLVYKLACRSDVSPARMKIVMHENKNKYALRGVMYIPMNPEEERTDMDDWEPDLSKINVKEDDFAAYWGRYENTKDFTGAPPAFLEYARQLWLDNFIEK